MPIAQKNKEKTDASVPEFRRYVEALLMRWEADGLPSREALMSQAADLDLRRGSSRLWDRQPRLTTATLDDGVGQGIAVINRFAGALGLRVRFLGLLQRAERIIADLKTYPPDLLGLTVFYPEAEDDLIRISEALPPRTYLILGGPAFRYDPEMSNRARADLTATHVKDFIRFLLHTPFDTLTFGI